MMPPESLDITAQRVAAANAAEQPRVVFLEFWRPHKYVGSKGPRTFVRECLPVQCAAGPDWYMNAAGERVEIPVGQRTSKVSWNCSPWRAADPEFVRKALMIPGKWLELDQFPGVKFCVRHLRNNSATLDDFAQATALRVAHFTEPT